MVFSFHNVGVLKECRVTVKAWKIRVKYGASCSQPGIRRGGTRKMILTTKGGKETEMKNDSTSIFEKQVCTLI